MRIRAILKLVNYVFSLSAQLKLPNFAAPVSECVKTAQKWYILGFASSPLYTAVVETLATSPVYTAAFSVKMC